MTTRAIELLEAAEDVLNSAFENGWLTSGRAVESVGNTLRLSVAAEVIEPRSYTIEVRRIVDAFEDQRVHRVVALKHVRVALVITAAAAFKLTRAIKAFRAALKLVPIVLVSTFEWWTVIYFACAIAQKRLSFLFTTERATCPININSAFLFAIQVASVEGLLW